MRMVTFLAAVVIFVAGGMHSLKVARHPEDIERYRRQAIDRASSDQMVRRFKIIGVVSISVGLWLLVAAITFRGHVISWVAVIVTMAATFSFVVLVTRRLRLL